MVYDANGLGFSEITFLSVNYPSIFEEVENTLKENEGEALAMARKAIEAHNQNLIER